MWRSFFLALGMTLLLLGVQFLFVERVVLAYGKPAQTTTEESGFLLARTRSVTTPAKKKEIAPPDWAPWGLLAGGAVVMLYSFTIPKRVAS